MTLAIINISSRATLQRPIPFSELLKIPGLKLELRRLRNGKRGNPVVRNRNGPLITIYPNGTVWITGSKSAEDAEARVAWLRQALGDARLPSVGTAAVRNMVLQGRINIRADLATTYTRLVDRLDCIYDPEEFPAMRIRAPNCVMLLWNNSKIVLTGAKSLTDAEQDLAWLQTYADAAGITTLAEAAT